MKRRNGLLVIPIYLLILSAVFVPMSQVSWAELWKDLVIRLVVVMVFSLATTCFLNFGAVEDYRLTEVPAEQTSDGEIEPIEMGNEPVVPQAQLPRKRRKAYFAFWVAVAAIYWVTQTSWWNHQPWVSGFVDRVVRWGALLVCWGFLLLLWLPKPDANQPEELHVVPSKTSASGLSKSIT